jgi:hypothetical protein
MLSRDKNHPLIQQTNKQNSTPKPHPISKQIKSGELYKGPVVLLLLLSQAAKKELSHPAQLPVRMLSRALCLFFTFKV